MGESTTGLVRTPNGTYITKEAAKEAGLVLPVSARRKAPAKRKAASAAKKSPTRKATGVARGKGKR